MSDHRETYWIASALCREVKAFDGSVMTPEDKLVWLGWSNEGGGWPSVDENKNRAHHFKSAEAARKEAKSWDGMPWWYRLKPGTLKVFKIEEHRVSTRTETMSEVEP